VLSDTYEAGTTGAALNGAGAAGDPWGTALPGAYGAGSAGAILGTNLNATVSSRATQTSVDNVQSDTDNIQTRIPAALVGGRMDASLGAVAAGAITAASFAAGALDAVWSTAIRILTAGTNIVLAKGVGVTGFNDVSTAQVNAEIVDALNVDTYPEPGTGAPAATASLAAKIGYLYKFLRNRVTSNATTLTVYGDDGTTANHHAAQSDTAGLYDRGKFGA
jgi:hypothetical protein